MADDLVTIASFTHPVEAWVQKLRLDHAGVKSFVADDNIVSMYWLYSNAVGGVKLQVVQADLQAAAEILSGEGAVSRDSQAEFSADVPATTCPKCGSAEIYWKKCWRRVVFLCWLLLGCPLPILRRSWTCFDCHAWGQLPIQFTLRTLLILTFIVAVVCSVLRTISVCVPHFAGAQSIPYP